MLERIALLQAIQPAKNCFRFYEVSCGRDLLNDWLVQIRNGRIGTHGRVRLKAFASWPEAQREIRLVLKRRGSVGRRVEGAYYHVCEIAEGFENDALH
jgi:predicted DNA-binding WGR domain protein